MNVPKVLGQDLQVLVPPYSSTGKVRVSLGANSTTFTVVPGGDYFDEPGSTITFTTSRSDGHLYLTQTADGYTRRTTVIPAAAMAASAPVAAKQTWQRQADNFATALYSWTLHDPKGPYAA